VLEFWIYVHNSRLHFGAVLQSYSITSTLVSTYSSRVCTLQVLYSLTIHLVSPCQTRCLSTSPSCLRLFNTLNSAYAHPYSTISAWVLAIIPCSTPILPLELPGFHLVSPPLPIQSSELLRGPDTSMQSLCILGNIDRIAFAMEWLCLFTFLTSVVIELTFAL
jgi:hypothetical protein